MKELTLQGTTYEIPLQGESPTWGEQLSDYLQALNDVVSGLSGPYDSLNKLFPFNNNASATISGAAIDPTVVNGVILTYSARRVTSSVTATETGQITVTYNSSNPTNEKFDSAQFQSGSAGLTFSITDAGLINLQTNLLAGTGHVGRLRFSIKAFEI